MTSAEIKEAVIQAVGIDDEEILFADGFEEALVGVGERCGMGPTAIYDYHKSIEILMKRDGMTEEDAVEYFEFNVIGGFVGERTPIFGTFFLPAKSEQDKVPHPREDN